MGCAAGSPFSFLGCICSWEWDWNAQIRIAAELLITTPLRSVDACGPAPLGAAPLYKEALTHHGGPWPLLSHEPAYRRARRHCFTCRGTRWAPGIYVGMRRLDGPVEPSYFLYFCKDSHVAA